MNVFINYKYRMSELEHMCIDKLARFVLEREGYASDCNANVSITFVDNEEMKSLNSQFRGIDAPTDVLSFEFEGEDDADFGFISTPEELDATKPDANKPDTSKLNANKLDAKEPATSKSDAENSLPVELGDVIIAPDVAFAQCEDYNMTKIGEISLLLVHGLLHLCGYDHIENSDAKIMQDREICLLKEWQKTHPDISLPDYEIDAQIVIGEH